MTVVCQPGGPGPVAPLRLPEAVRTGKPIQAFDRPEEGVPFWKRLVPALFPLNRAPAGSLGAELRRLHPEGELRILDVAAGSGVWGIGAAQGEPRVRVTESTAGIRAKNSPGGKPGTVSNLNFRLQRTLYIYRAYAGRRVRTPEDHLNGPAVAFNYTLNVHGKDLKLDYAGTVEGDTIKGKAVFGQIGEGTFTARRK